MSEEKQSTVPGTPDGGRLTAEKKKFRTIRRILWLIGLILLALLILLMLIFQAPWKVTALLIIILLACTVLPKPYRKWFWLSVGAVVIALIIWVFLPEDTEGWRPYKYNFDKEFAALEAKYAIPPEENAAIIYNQLLEDYNEAAFEPNFLDSDLEYLTRTEPWSSNDFPQVAGWLKEQKHIIDKLLEASKVEKCRFPVFADIVAYSEHIEILSPMRCCAFLLSRSASNDFGEGRIKESLDKYFALLQMGNHMCQQTIMIDWLVGIAIRALALNQFNRFIISSPEETHLKAIEQALENINHNWSDDFPRIIEDEILIAKQSLAPYYEINPKGKIRLSRDPLKETREKIRKFLKDEEKDKEINNENLKDAYEQLRNAQERIAYPSYFEKKHIKAKTILYWFYLPSTPQKAAKIIDAAYEKYLDVNDSNIDWEYETRKPSMTAILYKCFRYMTEYWVIASKPLLSRIRELHLRQTANIRGARIIITLRRYKNQNGHWPENLDEIKPLAPAEIFVDPINNDSFVYKLTEESFTLYSKGKNNIDEDGQYNTTWDPNTFKSSIKEDDRSIWPPKRSKTQKGENSDEQQ